MQTLSLIPPPSTDDQRFRLKYTPAFDGLRALAVIAVMVFHSGFFLNGGFIGVDIFFILSGFLITSLLINEYDHYKRISLKKFYGRRILRLAPALLTLLCVYLIITFVITSLSHQQDTDNIIDASIVLVYMANWSRAFNIHPPMYLGHTWSLSIEEQFYILWPTIFIILMRSRLSRQKIVLAVFALTLFAWLWRIYLLNIGTSFDRIYNGLDTRADELLAGCGLAILLTLNLSRLRSFLSQRALLSYISVAAGALLVGMAIFLRYDDLEIYRWSFMVIEFCAAVIIVDILFSKRSRLRPLLELKGLVQIGRISYGLYLWHFLILRLIGVGGGRVLIISGVLAFIAAILSYKFIEQPALKKKKRFEISRPDPMLSNQPVPD